MSPRARVVLPTFPPPRVASRVVDELATLVDTGSVSYADVLAALYGEPVDLAVALAVRGACTSGGVLARVEVLP